MNWCVTTKKTSKEKQINFRVGEEVKFDLEVTAEIRGLSVSSWIHFLIVQASHIAKAENMARFQEIAERHKKEEQADTPKTQNISIIKQGVGANDRKGQNK